MEVQHRLGCLGLAVQLDRESVQGLVVQFGGAAGEDRGVLPRHRDADRIPITRLVPLSGSTEPGACNHDGYSLPQAREDCAPILAGTTTVAPAWPVRGQRCPMAAVGCMAAP